MAHWSCSKEGDRNIWRRSLGSGESSFYWYSVQEGALDAVQYEELEVLETHSITMSRQNIEHAWLAVKKRYPLLAARTVRKTDEELLFEVDEQRIKTITEGELIVGELSSNEEVEFFKETFLCGPRLLADEINVKVIIKGGPRRRPGWISYHLWLIAAHTISDGAANMSLFTTFAEMLTCPSSRVTKESVGERLAKVPDGGTLHHPHGRSLAHRRWKRVIAFVLLEVRESHIKVGDSHTRRH